MKNDELSRVLDAAGSDLSGSKAFIFSRKIILKPTFTSLEVDA